MSDTLCSELRLSASAILGIPRLANRHVGIERLDP